jgi:hemolysin III
VSAGVAPDRLAEPLPVPARADGRPALRGWLHAAAVAAVLGLAPLVESRARTGADRLLCGVYLAGLATNFGTSALFHRLRWAPAARRRVRRLDHAAIFLAIAGTYTAVAGIALPPRDAAVVLTLVWTGALAGTVMRLTWLDAPKWVVAAPYLVVGWTAVVVLPELLHALGGPGFTLLVSSGVVDSLGALAYARRRPDPWPRVLGYHELFHLATVIAAAMRLALVVFVLLPRH